MAVLSTRMHVYRASSIIEYDSSPACDCLHPSQLNRGLSDVRKVDLTTEKVEETDNDVSNLCTYTSRTVAGDLAMDTTLTVHVVTQAVPYAKQEPHSMQQLKLHILGSRASANKAHRHNGSGKPIETDR